MACVVLLGFGGEIDQHNEASRWAGKWRRYKRQKHEAAQRLSQTPGGENIVAVITMLRVCRKYLTGDLRVRLRVQKWIAWPGMARGA